MSSQKFVCPCCGHRTLTEKPPGTYNICQVCFWEDDPIQFENPDYEGGANQVSLRQGQKNFQEYGACDMDATKMVRRPNIDEPQDEQWHPLD